MLKAGEVLWPKPLPPLLLALLRNGGGLATTDDVRKLAYFESYIDRAAVARLDDTTRAVTYRVPHNSAVQVADYSAKTTRIVFGPELVVLGPHEEFQARSAASAMQLSNTQCRC